MGRTAPVPVAKYRFAFRHVEEDRGYVTPCWIWQGAVNHQGYGRIAAHRVNGVKGTTGAHRGYYERLVGPIPAGLDLDHLCRTRVCVNPDHLEPVTNAENCRRGWEARGTVTNVCVECGVEYEAKRIAGAAYCSKWCAIQKFRRPCCDCGKLMYPKTGVYQSERCTSCASQRTGKMRAPHLAEYWRQRRQEERER